MNLPANTFTSRPRRTHPSRGNGFTFLEVLFAVMILGIGFILVAAMFPAAIKQTLATVEDSTGSAVWIGMHRKLMELAKTPILPIPIAPLPKTYLLDKYMQASGTGKGNSIVYSFHDARLPAANRNALWSVACGNLLVDFDHHYACVPFFRREIDLTNALGSAEVQLMLVPVHVRNKAEYDLTDVASTSTTMAYLDPTRFNITVKVAAPGQAPTILLNNAFDLGRTLTKTSAPITEDTPAGVGAYVIISDGPPPTGAIPSKNGQIYRLGARVDPTDPTLYYIAPDSQGATDVYQVGPPPFKTYTADAFIVGRGISNDPSSTFDGPPQDLGVIPAPIKVR